MSFPRFASACVFAFLDFHDTNGLRFRGPTLLFVRIFTTHMCTLLSLYLHDPSPKDLKFLDECALSLSRFEKTLEPIE